MAAHDSKRHQLFSNQDFLHIRTDIHSAGHGKDVTPLQQPCPCGKRHHEAPAQALLRNDCLAGKHRSPNRFALLPWNVTGLTMERVQPSAAEPVVDRSWKLWASNTGCEIGCWEFDHQDTAVRQSVCESPSLCMAKVYRKVTRPQRSLNHL